MTVHFLRDFRSLKNFLRPDAEKPTELKARSKKEEFTNLKDVNLEKQQFYKLLEKQETTNLNRGNLLASNSPARLVDVAPFSEAEKVSEIPEVQSPEIISSVRENYTETKNKDLKKKIEDIAISNRIDPKLALAIVKVESNFNTNAVSLDGHATKGLFQLKDTTGKEIKENHYPNIPYDPFNPETNAMIAATHINHLYSTYSKSTEVLKGLKTEPVYNKESLDKFVIASFNAGEGRVASAQRNAKMNGLNPSLYSEVEPYLPKTTRNYVSKVVAGIKNTK